MVFRTKAFSCGPANVELKKIRRGRAGRRPRRFSRPGIGRPEISICAPNAPAPRRDAAAAPDRKSPSAPNRAEHHRQSAFLLSPKIPRRTRRTLATLRSNRGPGMQSRFNSCHWRLRRMVVSVSAPADNVVPRAFWFEVGQGLFRYEFVPGSEFFAGWRDVRAGRSRPGWRVASFIAASPQGNARLLVNIFGVSSLSLGPPMKKIGMAGYQRAARSSTFS